MSEKQWITEGYEAFSRGQFGNGGQNLYVSREKGVLQRISFKNTERFNFAFDVVDAMAAKQPDKLAMLHVDRNKQERRFSFGDMSKTSSRAANYFKSLGVKKGDRVMLVLKRHWQFW